MSAVLCPVCLLKRGKESEMQHRPYSPGEPRYECAQCGLVTFSPKGIAEVFFKAGKVAGVKKVVAFVVEHIFPLVDLASVPVSFKDRWNEKLKEWGIEGVRWQS